MDPRAGLYTQEQKCISYQKRESKFDVSNVQPTAHFLYRLNYPKAKKEYLENACTEIMEFHRTGRYDLMYMKTKELGWKDTQGIQNIGIEDSQGNRIVDQKHLEEL